MALFDKTDLFLSVIETHKGIIYKIANIYCKEREDKKDLVQEIILQLWKSFDNYNEQYKYSTWIYRIALNVAISFYRKETRRKEIAKPYSGGLFNLDDFKQSTDLEGHTSFLQQFIAGISETNVATKIGRIKIILKQKFSEIKI